MIVTALRQIYGRYGSLAAGQSKDIDDGLANELIRAGYVTAGSDKSYKPPVAPLPEVESNTPVIANKAKG